MKKTSLNSAAYGVCLAALFALSTGSLAHAVVLPLPQVSPVPDDGKLPLASALYPKGNEYSDLGAAGYVEKEFYLSGQADAVSAIDGAVVAAAQPYVTRILVRMPTDPARFSGTVVVEPFSFGGERAGGWTKIRKDLLAHGDAWIGITLMSKEERSPRPGGPAGLQELKTYDPARYGPLKMYAGQPGQFMRAVIQNVPGVGPKPVLRDDNFAPQGQMILAELATLIKSNAPGSPLKGLDVKRFYTVTWQVQAQLWLDYLNQGRHTQWRLADGRPLVDGYMVGNYSGNMPVPSNLPDDAIFVVVRSMREISSNALDGVPQGPDSDAPRVRVYDFPGSAHIGSRDVGSGALQIAEQQAASKTAGATSMPSGLSPSQLAALQTAAGAAAGGPPPAPRAPRPAVCTTGLSYDEPVEPIVSAIFSRMEDWAQTGKPMPEAPRVTIVGGKTVKDPATNLPVGGLRPPWIEAPAATYLVGDEVGCGADDVKVPYTAAMLKARYGDYAGYVKAFNAAKAQLIKSGFLLPEDSGDVQPIVGPEAFN